MKALLNILVGILAVGQFGAWSADGAEAPAQGGVPGPGPDDKVVSFTIPFEEKDCQAQALRNKFWEALKKAKADVEGQGWPYGTILVATGGKPETVRAIQEAFMQYKKDVNEFVKSAIPTPEVRAVREKAEANLLKQKPNREDWTRDDFEVMNKSVALKISSNWVEWSQDTIDGVIQTEVVNTKKGAMMITIGLSVPAKQKLWRILQQDQQDKKF